jgi:Mn2+/Fe2+ NRAMP family transporter
VLAGSGYFLGVLTGHVQVLAGILLPSAVLFLTLLCNDKDILGPWVIVVPADCAGAPHQ